MSAHQVVEFFSAPPRLYRRREVTGRTSAAPREPGIYGWYFDELPGGCRFRAPLRPGFQLLYVGIAPGGPPRSLKPSTLRSRINTHCRGNADASTLRLTLGCLLGERLGIALGRTPGGRFRFGQGEAVLSDWMDLHARVAWVVHSEPWTVEAEVVQALDVPLNRAHNQGHPFYDTLGEVRRMARALARPL